MSNSEMVDFIVIKNVPYKNGFCANRMSDVFSILGKTAQIQKVSTATISSLSAVFTQSVFHLTEIYEAQVQSVDCFCAWCNQQKEEALQSNTNVYIFSNYTQH